jgi:Zn-dependent protease with chaperone function
MIHIPGALIFLTWVLIGPVSIHHDLPMLILPAFAMSILGIGVLMRRSSREQSIALLSVLGIMFFESLQSIGRWLHIEVVHSPFIEGEEVRHFISFFFTLNAGLAAIGAVAALGVALSLQVRKAGLPLTRLFPEMQFATATSEVIRAVERLSKVAGIPPPNVSIIDSGDPAAFITHSKQGYVLAVSVGLLESMNADELDACLAA